MSLVQQPEKQRKNQVPLLSLFQPDPPMPLRNLPPPELARLTARWRWRILISSIIGYALFYFVRKNLSVAMPAIEKDLGITKVSLGLFLTLHGVIYGLSKFANGFLGDRANARVFMATGLILSALMNVFFGFSSAVVFFGVFWMLNGWFQGMGFPPCARVMTHWFSPRELAFKMSIWNTSHSIGAAAVLILCGYLVEVNWRLCFFVPAGLAILTAFALLPTLRDSPESIGLPEMEGTAAAATDTGRTTSFGAFLARQVFSNPFIWIIAVANFFVYSVRYALLDWGPTLLQQGKGFQPKDTGWMLAAFEVSGIVGMLASGWLTDHVFGGRGARTCLFSMGFAAMAVLGFWKLPGSSMMLNTLLLCMAGFFIYGPQALVGITVANLATKRAAASAIGLTGLFGYASTVVSGVGFGYVAEHYGWDTGFLAIIGLGTVGTLLFLAAWPARAHGYQTAENN